MRDGINGSFVHREGGPHSYVKSSGIKSTLDCKAAGRRRGLLQACRRTNAFLKPEAGELMGEVLNGTAAYWGFPDFQW
jgi:hypothetical protein